MRIPTRKIYHYLAFFLSILLFVSCSYPLFFRFSWKIAPPSGYFLIMAGVLIFFAAKGWMRQTMTAKIRNLTTLLLLALLLLMLISQTAFDAFGKEKLQTSYSPDTAHRVDFYHLNGGAASGITLIGEQNGPLWFRKTLYINQRPIRLQIVWLNGDTVSINNHPYHL